MLVIFGWRSSISNQLRELVCERQHFGDEFIRATFSGGYPLDAERYFFASGYLAGKPLADLTNEEFVLTENVNYLEIVGACDSILAANPRARICVIGSESGITGSYDEWYAKCKRQLHRYVERKKLRRGQQLVAIAPGIIEDAGMTTRRTDCERLNARREAHPQGRFATSLEVAQLAYFLLYEGQGYISNTVIRMNGGEHTNERG